MTLKSKWIPLFSFFLAGLGGCAAPGDDFWPTVSFGPEIEATEEALNQTPEVALAPLPTLLPKETEGIANQTAYINGIEADFRDIIANLNARFEDYQKARNGLSLGRAEAKIDHWLTAQMELSNISQNTEDLTKLRARLSAIPQPLPERARVLQAQIEARELQSRLFLRGEKQKLQELEPA